MFSFAAATPMNGRPRSIQIRNFTALENEALHLNTYVSLCLILNVCRANYYGRAPQFPAFTEFDILERSHEHRAQWRARWRALT